MKNSKIKEDECITFNASLPIVKIFNGFLKLEKLHTRFKSRINLNQRKFQYIEWRKNIVQIFNFCDIKGKYFLDLPYNMFHTLISTGLLKIKNNKEKIKILRKWNEVILNIYSLDGYVTMFINSLDETNSYDLYKEICDFFYKKDNTHEEIREIIKQNRIQANYNITSTFFNYNLGYYRIWDKKQFRSLTKKEKKQYNELLHGIPNKADKLMINKLIDYSIGIMCEKEIIKLEI